MTYGIGNTAGIAAKHYLQVPDEAYDKAAHFAAHEAQHPSASASMGQYENLRQSPKNADLAPIGAQNAIAKSEPLEAGGFEPPSRDVSGQASTRLVVLFLPSPHRALDDKLPIRLFR